MGLDMVVQGLRENPSCWDLKETRKALINAWHSLLSPAFMLPQSSQTGELPSRFLTHLVSPAAPAPAQDPSFTPAFHSRSSSPGVGEQEGLIRRHPELLGSISCVTDFNRAAQSSPCSLQRPFQGCSLVTEPEQARWPWHSLPVSHSASWDPLEGSAQPP